ncbi:MAG: type VI-A CRISPR-associated RNA-guided ribonuclease Cas13a [Allosphingosinicella sp.]
MQIIKPYGRSHVEADAAGKRRRILTLRSDPNSRIDVETFASTHDRLVIAQWISVIDKIARKPAAGRVPSHEQRTFREKLGEAAWDRLLAGGRLPGAADPAERERLRDVWRWKIAPYEVGEVRGSRPSHASAKGRWYDGFRGAADDVSTADTDAIARGIEEHLHGVELGAGAGTARREGLIAARAQSIVANVASAPSPAYAGGCGDGWTLADERSYAAAGNVALQIRRAAELREQGKDPRKLRRVSPDVAGPILYAHYGRLFREPDGRVLTIAESRVAAPGLFNLHCAVKDSYSRLLSRRIYVPERNAELSAQTRPLSTLLPDTMEALFALVDAKGANRDLNALVRLGKVIHYEAAGSDPDTPEAAVAKWPAHLEASRYWTSDGQLDIKRSEAFVRIWRRVLGLAGRTLTDWADPAGTIGGDILMRKQRERALGDEFDPDPHARKLDLLFGGRATVFGFADESDQRAVLNFALRGVYDLRNAAFHFTGSGGFARALAKCCRAAAPPVLEAARSLWALDRADRSRLGIAIARAAQFDRFFGAEEIARLVEASAGRRVGTLPLPRLVRVLQRAGNALAGTDAEARRLDMPSRSRLRDPATFCRFEALKLLYDGPFRDWLSSRDSADVNGFIDFAVARSTATARSLNGKGDSMRETSIVSRASKLGRLQPRETVSDFFFRLSAESATEFRVQRAYQSDRASARAQADYIEKLKLDVVALAFGEFLASAGFGFVTNLTPGTAPVAGPSIATALPEASTDPEAEDWQVALYFFLHLVPVDDVARLMHQVQRWASNAPRSGSAAGSSTELLAVLALYCDMHDSKFEGSTALSQVEPFRDLFESQGDFDRIFPVLGPDELRLCRRGLREVMRFGHVAPLRSIFRNQWIGTGDVREFLAANRRDPDGSSPIARLQAEREALHEIWVRQGRGFTAAHRDRYRVVLGQVVRYRHLAAHVTLNDHIRLHRLLVAIWSRLVDFTGLWERDLYFVTLALIHLEGRTPREALGSKALYFLARGQIIEALRKARLSAFAESVLSLHFTGVWKEGSRVTRIRNKVSHFAMLRQADAPDLTYWINQCRELLRHDRKLRNAVPASVKELLRQTGIEIEWRLRGHDHDLGASRVTTRRAKHLGNDSMTEDLNGDRFVAMTAALFGDSAPHKAVQRPPRLADAHRGAPQFVRPSPRL